MFRTSIKTCFLACLPLAAGLSICSATASSVATTTLGQEAPQARASVAAEVGDLKLQLEKGLRARRPEEFAFVALVVTMVANDDLPLDLVKSAFLWARKKALTKRYPFPDFERALRELAGKKGIKIE